MGNQVLKFIEKWQKIPGAIDTFTKGGCAWFAYILVSRFPTKDFTFVYAPIDNHFGIKYEDEIYDITGIVTDKYEWIDWELMVKEDPKWSARIARDCFYFTELGI